MSITARSFLQGRFGPSLKVLLAWAQQVKNPPAMQKTQARSLVQEDPLEEEMATYSSILAWRIPWTEKLGTGYSPLVANSWK